MTMLLVQGTTEGFCLLAFLTVVLLVGVFTLGYEKGLRKNR